MFPSNLIIHPTPPRVEGVQINTEQRYYSRPRFQFVSSSPRREIKKKRGRRLGRSSSLHRSKRTDLSFHRSTRRGEKIGGGVSRAVLGSNEVTRQRFNAGAGVKPFRKERGSLARGEKVNLASVNSSVLPATYRRIFGDSPKLG